MCHVSAYKRNFCHVLNCSCFNTVPQLKPKLNNAETKKSFHEFSFINKAGAALVTTITSLNNEKIVWKHVVQILALTGFRLH